MHNAVVTTCKSGFELDEAGDCVREKARKTRLSDSGKTNCFLRCKMSVIGPELTSSHVRLEAVIGG